MADGMARSESSTSSRLGARFRLALDRLTCADVRTAARRCLLGALVGGMGLAVPTGIHADDEALRRRDLAEDPAFASDADALRGEASPAAPAEPSTGQTGRKRAGSQSDSGRRVEDPNSGLYEHRPAQYRQIPGKARQQLPFPITVYEQLPSIDEHDKGFVRTPDRWRLFYKGKWYDPYNQNVLKADVPIFGGPGEHWFIDVAAVSDTLFEGRNLPIPVGGPSTQRPGSNNTFGRYRQFMAVENLLTSIALIKGNTAFKPPDLEFRITPVWSLNYADVEETSALRVDPQRSSERWDNHMGLQELFIDYHLGNVSHRYDFVSVRAGIQPFISDFRGFLYNVQEPGVRLFGNLQNNHWQYNLAWFSRLDKDTNSGLNTFESRHEDVFIANLYRQDYPILGHQMQGIVAHRIDTAGDYGQDYDNNGFLVRPSAIGDLRPKNVYTTYFGLNTDGHIGRLNTTTSLYYATGSESHNQIAQRQVDVNAFMGAAEASWDFDWMRLRGSAFYASGDKDPFDGKATGFDAIFDNPNFAGGDFGYIQRQGIPLIGGGGVNLINRNSFLANFRPGKEEGQSNFVNPGIRFLNAGVDFEVTPEIRNFNNVSYLQFDQTGPLKAVRNDGSFGRNIGVDVSTGFLYRPFLNNNIQFRTGAGVLFPGDGVQNLYGNKVLWDVFTNIIFLY